MTVPDLSTREGREQMRKIADAATPGPWTVDEDGGVDAPGVWPVVECTSGDAEDIMNGAFIASSRTAVPALLDIADAAEARAERAEAALQRVRYELALWDAAPEGSIMPVEGAATLIRRALDGEL